jgi:hypothetical protein
MTGYDIHMFFHIVCGWVDIPGCKVFVRPAGGHISVSAFLPQYKNGKRLKRNRKVYIQLARHLGEWEWTGKSYKFDWKKTTSNIQAQMTEYYNKVIMAESGDVDGVGSEQVKMIERMGLAEYMSGSSRYQRPVFGEYADCARSAIFNCPTRKEKEEWYAGDNAHASTRKIEEELSQTPCTRV